MTANECESFTDPSSQIDAPTVDRFLPQYLPLLLGYIRHHADPVVRQHESCEDILQSVCREVIEHQDDFDYRGQEAFRAWLFKTALNKLIDRKRYYTAEKRHPRREVYISNVSGCSRIHKLVPPPLSPSQAASTKEEIQRLEQAFSLLSEDHQRVIRYSRFVGMSQAEIAEEMDRSIPAVRTLLHRALGNLGLLMHRAEQGRLPTEDSGGCSQKKEVGETQEAKEHEEPGE